MAILFDNIRVFLGGAFFPAQKVLLEKGKIAAVGSKILKTGDVVIDGQKKFLIPGLVDAHTHLTLGDQDNHEGSLFADDMYDPITPQLRPLDGVKMRDRLMEEARRAGVSTCMVCPGPVNPISGQCSILKTYGHSADVGTIVEAGGVKFSFGEEAKRQYRAQKKIPSTRMGIVGLIRETLMKAQDYHELKESKKGIRDRIMKYECMIPLLEGKVPMRAHACHLDDIMTAIRIAEEFKLKIIIEHGIEAHKIGKLLAKKKIPVVLGPVLVPHIDVALNEEIFRSANSLMDDGVEVALTCDYPGLPMESLRLAAALAVQYGLEEKRAMMAITETPAKILGLEGRLGQIKKGFDADVAVFNGHPLDLRSKLEMLIIDGETFQF